MQNLIIEKLLAKNRRTDIPKFAAGDTVRVQVRIKEGDKERLQAFEGVVISRTRGPQDQLRSWRGAYFPTEFESDR
jgi:ribosomal protein L19